MRRSQPTFNEDSDLRISIPSGQKTQLSQSYSQAKRVVNNKMKGGKIQLSQYRQKQQLKTQAVNNQNVRGYIHMNQIFYEEDITDFDPSHLRNRNNFNQYAEQNYSTKPRTALTADPTIKDRRLKLAINQQSQAISRTMMVTSNGFRSTMSPKSPKRVTSYFTSNNLDNKANDFMNLMIRSDNTSKLEPLFLQQMHTDGMIPHCKKLNSFERRMKIRKKIKSQSKEKVKINLSQDIIDLSTISKTLQSISHHNQGPLVTHLQHKTIFRRSSKTESRRRQVSNGVY